MKRTIPQALFSLFVGTSLLTGPVAHADKHSKDSDSSEPQRIRSQKRLAKLLKERQPRYYAGFRPGLATLQAADSSTAPSSTPSYSSTLVQVAGVDEGDHVKNDGEFIYQINQGRVFVIDAALPNELTIAATLDFSDGNFYPQELYLDGARLVVIGTSFRAPEQVQRSEEHPSELQSFFGF